MKPKRRKIDPDFKEKFLADLLQAYADANFSDEQWEKIREENKLWENTLMDGLGDE